MRFHGLAQGLLSIVIAGGLAALTAVAGGHPATERGPVGTGSATAALPESPAAPQLDSLARILARTAPFRLRRSLAPVPYDPLRKASASAPPRPPTPSLALLGILWGRPASIVMAGLPGSDGARVLAPGDTAGGLRVRRVTRDEVLLTGYDTSWVLRVSR